MGWTIERDKVLFVEGNEEVRFFKALLREVGFQDIIQVRDYGGKTRLKEFITEFKKMPRFQSVGVLGIVRDADDNAYAAFQSVQDALGHTDLPVPAVECCLDGQSPAVAVLVLPGSQQPGMLEDLCLKSVEDDPALRCIDEFFDCLTEQGVPAPRNMCKARVHAFLASRSAPDKRLGEAAEAGYWPWESVAFTDVKAFLQLLAGA